FAHSLIMVGANLRSSISLSLHGRVGWWGPALLALAFACDADAGLDESASAAGTVLPPRNPRVPDPESTSGQVPFSWDTSPTAGITRYETSVQAGDAPPQIVDRGLMLTATIRMVTDGQYQLRVRACKGSSCSAYT